MKNLTQNPFEIIQRLKQNDLDDSELREILLALTPEQLSESLMFDWLTALLETAPVIERLPDSFLDCCGTGGSGLPHFNTSTTVAFILAAGGVPVVKFGNRGIQQPHGSFDFLAALGFDKTVSIEKIPLLLEKSNLSFLFAPQCYPYLALLHRVRKTLTSPTLFHYIGPLLNPALPSYRLMGISHKSIIPFVERAIGYHPQLSMHSKKAILVHTSLQDTLIGLDELSPIGKPFAIEISQQHRSNVTLFTAPDLPDAKFSIQCALKDLDVSDSVQIFKELLSGNIPTDSYQDWLQTPQTSITRNQQYAFCYELVTQNAALGFLAAEKVNSLEEGLEMTKELIKSNVVYHTFKRYQEAYHACTH